MCGFLIYPAKPTKALLAKHLEHQKHRGTDGYGAICLKKPNKTGTRTTKNLLKEPFLRQFNQLPRTGVIIHHRKASIGGIKAELVHPVTDFEQNVHVMHNGTRRDLVSMFWGNSDTCVLAEFWDKVDDEAMYCMLEKTGVVFIMDRGRLWFHRDSSRTLYYCTEGIAKGMYASEPREEGMWALVDQHILTELPLSVNQWNLEHDTPVSYSKKMCNRINCKNMIIGNTSTYCCPDCKVPRTQQNWPRHGGVQGRRVIT